MPIDWNVAVQLNDLDEQRLLDLTLDAAIDEASTFHPARLALAQIWLDDPIDVGHGLEPMLNADRIAELIARRKSSSV